MWKQAQYLQMKENSVISLQKYPSQGVRMKKKKGSMSLDQIACTFSLFAPPPPTFFLAPAATTCTVWGILKISNCNFLAKIVINAILNAIEKVSSRLSCLFDTKSSNSLLQPSFQG